jgi:ribose 5-phosphate isomerase B
MIVNLKKNRIIMKNIKKIAIACDHAGYRLKEYIKSYIGGLNYTVKDFGCFSEESSDYPDVAHPLAEAVEKGEYDKGITLCGTGNGISMAVNKHRGIRAALCWSEEIARLARQHNNANICSLPARFISVEEAVSIIKVFLETEFEGGRHQRRIDKIPISC